ncbi:MAG: hypothetical protein IJJ85_09755 [Clostridia bacterium]|nr:hypothetical protein [Clostridia bacterium]
MTTVMQRITALFLTVLGLFGLSLTPHSTPQATLGPVGVSVSNETVEFRLEGQGNPWRWVFEQSGDGAMEETSREEVDLPVWKRGFGTGRILYCTFEAKTPGEVTLNLSQCLPGGSPESKVSEYIVTFNVYPFGGRLAISLQSIEDVTDQLPSRTQS